MSELAEAISSGRGVPDKTVCVTFDDGFADFYTNALPLMEERDIVSTLYVTTSPLGNSQTPDNVWGAPMLSWGQLDEIATRNVEIGGHSHHHLELDTLRPSAALEEVTRCKAQLEDHLGIAVHSFAYPHGYSSRGVRAAVRKAGYRSACSVKNALSSTRDDVFTLPRLMLNRDTTLEDVRNWTAGIGVATSPPDDRAIAIAWRLARRLRAKVRPR